MKKDYPSWYQATFIYALAVCLFHIPILKNMGTNILAGWQVGGVFTWEAWWFRKSLLFDHSLKPFFTPFLMFPSGVPVFLHSPLYTLFCLILTPVANVYVTYNLYCLLGYVARGLSMYALAFNRTQHRNGALLAGFFYMFSHDSLTEHYLGHVAQANTVFVPLFVLCLLKLLKTPSNRNFSLFALAGLGCVTSTPYTAFHVLVGAYPTLTLAWVLKQKPSNFDKTTGYLLGGLIVFLLGGILCYWPIILQRQNLIGGSESYALQLQSFFDLPFWHRFHLFKDFLRTPEDSMGYLTLTIPLLILVGLRKSKVKEAPLWFALIAVGLIFSLGSYALWPGTTFKIPLPYLILKQVPLLNIFRTPARFIDLAWVGLCVLTAFAIKNIFQSFTAQMWQRGMLAALMILFCAELDVPRATARYSPLQYGEAYHLISSDQEPFGVLEVPVAIDNEGNVTINAQYFMLHQPLHEKPLVLGRPHRHTLQSLDLLQNTPYLFELTHPEAIVQLYDTPDLSTRRKELISKGRQILQDHGIKYVLFHRDEDFFSPLLRGSTLRLLIDTLHEPILSDQFGILVFKVYE